MKTPELPHDSEWCVIRNHVDLDELIRMSVREADDHTLMIVSPVPAYLKMFLTSICHIKATDSRRMVADTQAKRFVYTDITDYLDNSRRAIVPRGSAIYAGWSNNLAELMDYLLIDRCLFVPPTGRFLPVGKSYAPYAEAKFKLLLRWIPMKMMIYTWQYPRLDKVPKP